MTILMHVYIVGDNTNNGESINSPLPWERVDS